MIKRRIPFHARASSVRWPNGESLAVRMSVALEWYGEVKDARSNSISDLAAASEFDEYAFEVAVWRTLELLSRLDVRATFSVSAKGAELYPEVIREIVKSGHEISGHGYVQSVAAALQGPDAEREEVQRCTAILTDVSGQRPVGWVSPGAICTRATIEALIDHDYLWHGDLRDDDLPYVIEHNGGSILEVPHRTHSANDFAMFGGKGMSSVVKGLRSPAAAATYLHEVLDAYLATSKREGPLMVPFGFHPYNAAIPDRIQALESVVGRLATSPDTWLPTTTQLARYWQASVQPEVER